MKSNSKVSFWIQRKNWFIIQYSNVFSSHEGTRWYFNVILIKYWTYMTWNFRELLYWIQGCWRYSDKTTPKSCPNIFCPNISNTPVRHRDWQRNKWFLIHCFESTSLIWNYCLLIPCFETTSQNNWRLIFRSRNSDTESLVLNQLFLCQSLIRHKFNILSSKLL